MVSGKSNLVDIDVEIHHETEKAFLVYAGEDDKDGNPIKIWLPKSKVENNDDGTITMLEWLAVEKGLI